MVFFEFFNCFLHKKQHSGPAEAALVKIKIVSLPSNGILKLSGSEVVVSQEILVADINSLTFMPNTSWIGTTIFDWNGSNGARYAANAAKINIKIAVLAQGPYVCTTIIFAGRIA